MFDFTDPSSSGRPGSRPCPHVAISACASIGSPSRVPVPCPSTTSTCPGPSPAAASAARITRCWLGPFGAVSPLLAPSWFTALPRTTASTLCPSRRASLSRSSTTRPAPSDHPTPSAASAYDLHRPSSASPPCRVNSVNVPGVAITVTPPASASEHSPPRSACAARCIATSDDEHAVSIVTAGPSNPNTYDTRPEAMLGALPFPRNPSNSGPPSRSRQSLYITPPNPGSNPPASCKTPPHRVADRLAARGSGSNSAARSQPRSAGNSDTASTPPATRSHTCPGETTPPGYRHATPAITPGPPPTAPAATATGPAASPDSSPSRNPDSTPALG